MQIIIKATPYEPPDLFWSVQDCYHVDEGEVVWTYHTVFNMEDICT